MKARIVICYRAQPQMFRDSPSLKTYVRGDRFSANGLMFLRSVNPVKFGTTDIDDLNRYKGCKNGTDF
jgi:hypothetical protein